MHRIFQPKVQALSKGVQIREEGENSHKKAQKGTKRKTAEIVKNSDKYHK